MAANHFPAVLSLSFAREKLARREEALNAARFEVISVGSPSQARYEIELGKCGVFITCPLVAEIVSVDLLKLFKKFCPSGITIAVGNSRSSSALREADIVVSESSDPSGIVEALFARLGGPLS